MSKLKTEATIVLSVSYYENFATFLRFLTVIGFLFSVFLLFQL